MFAVKPSARPSIRFLLVAFALALSMGAAALDFPALTGRVVDQSGILAATRTALEGKLAALEAKTTDQLVVATVRSLQGTSIEDFGNQLFRHWQLGQKDKNNGVLLLVAPTERKVRIEVGRGLEGTLTDAVSRLIIENSILPRFRAADFPGGIDRGVDDIVQVLTGDAEEWKRRAATRRETTPAWLAPTLPMLIFIAIIIIFILMASRQQQLAGTPHGARRRGQDTGWWQGPTWGGGSSDWSSGSGGFSGGGGDSGGGGASGSW